MVRVKAARSGMQHAAFDDPADLLARYNAPCRSPEARGAQRFRSESIRKRRPSLRTACLRAQDSKSPMPSDLSPERDYERLNRTPAAEKQRTDGPPARPTLPYAPSSERRRGVRYDGKPLPAAQSHDAFRVSAMRQLRTVLRQHYCREPLRPSNLVRLGEFPNESFHGAF